MRAQTTRVITEALRYIEDHLDDKLELSRIAATLHYSKFHLHRMFAKTVGLTIHDYVQRRQLTEAAKLLVFSKKPLIDIALASGYESQQAFTGSFKTLYKIAPAEFRAAENFYPLQLEILLKEDSQSMSFTKDDIQFATSSDVSEWMELVHLTIDGYPYLNEADYLESLHRHIDNKHALILRDGGVAIGAMGFSPKTGSIDFLAVHPQYRKHDIARVFLDKFVDELLCGEEVSLTTYRAGDKADTGYREEYRRLGFAERELLVEYGYPTQRFVLTKKETHD